jgi:hypothetical protein
LPRIKKGWAYFVSHTKRFEFRVKKGKLMDIFFQDPTEVPLPPAEVRIRELTAKPWPDGRRVRVYFEVDPFQKRPNAEIVIFDSSEAERARLNVIESMDRKMEFTMHLRGADTNGRYKVAAVLYYNPNASDDEPQKDQEVSPGEPQIIDRAITSFDIPDDRVSDQ